MSAEPVLAVELAGMREAIDALREEVRGLRTELRRTRAGPALVAALEGFFGESRFTVAILLTLADDEPHGAVAEALSNMLDMNASARSRATQLGAKLIRMAEIEVVDRSHGCAIYRLRRTSTPEAT